jgi:hypothetical protein
MIRALASAGQYSRPEVTDYVERTFRERRDRIGRYWFSVVSPLESFELSLQGTSARLRFRDLAVERGYSDSGARRYRFDLRAPARLEILQSGTSETASEMHFDAGALTSVGAPDRFGRSPVLVVDVFAMPDALPVRVFIGNDPASPGPKVLGVQHAPR